MLGVGAGPVSITQLAGLRLCLEALATTGTIPDGELFRLHDRISMLGVLQGLEKSVQRVGSRPTYDICKLSILVTASCGSAYAKLNCIVMSCIRI